jgi:hypothetical protein
MTEEELIEIGFEKVDVYDVDSNNGYDYYYYQKKIIDGLTLVSSDSTEASGNKWIVYNPDWNKVKIKSKEGIAILELLANIWGDGNS